VLNNPLSLTDPTGYEAQACPDESDCTSHMSYTPTGSHIAVTATATKQSDWSVKVTSNNRQVAKTIAKNASATFGNGGSSSQGAGDVMRGTGEDATSQNTTTKVATKNNIDGKGSGAQNSSSNDASLSGKRRISAHPDGNDGPTITFNNDVPGGDNTDKPVSARLANVIEGAVTETGYSININSTTGGHGPRDPHTEGRAVDINRINGIRVSDLRSYYMVQNFMKAVEKYNWVNQVIGPSNKLSGDYFNGKLLKSRPLPTWLLLEHLNHIHVNVTRRVFDHE
jgi:hypothetical protein